MAVAGAPVPGDDLSAMLSEQKRASSFSDGVASRATGLNVQTHAVNQSPPEAVIESGRAGRRRPDRRRQQGHGTEGLRLGPEQRRPQGPLQPPHRQDDLTGSGRSPADSGMPTPEPPFSRPEPRESM